MQDCFVKRVVCVHKIRVVRSENGVKKHVSLPFRVVGSPSCAK